MFFFKLEVVTLNAFHEEIFYCCLKKLYFLVEGDLSCDKLASTKLANLL